MFLLASHMGLRRQEIASVKLGDIRGNELRIHGKGAGYGGKKATRLIHDEVAKTIGEYLPIREKTIELYGDYSEDNLLINLTNKCGTRIDDWYLQHLVTRARNRTKVDFSLHALRRLYGQIIYNSGIDSVDLQHMMRHSAFLTTAQYIESSPGAEERAYEAIDLAKMRIREKWDRKGKE